jgi:hypothetical protein
VDTDIIDELKKINMTNKTKYHTTLASYFASNPFYLFSPTQKQPSTRKLVEQPWQRTEGELMRYLIWPVYTG